jgi:beta-fructofuranosidase
MTAQSIKIMNRFFAFSLVIGTFASLCFAEEPQKTERKTLVAAGDFVKIYDPSVGEKEKWYINDHCFLFGEGKWHLFGITHAEPANPRIEIEFAHATAESLLERPWDKQPFALTVAKEAPWNELHLWAPHVVFHDGTYYMYYCAGDPDPKKYRIHLATSKDLKTWTRHPKNPMVADGIEARDPFILRHGGQWLMYYTASTGFEHKDSYHAVACVRSDDLVNWHDRTFAYVDPQQGTFAGPTESPFVVRRGKNYYLFVGPRPDYNGTDVFVSDDPLHWTFENKVGHIDAHCAEVIRDKDGKWYVSRAGWGQGGVYLAPLTWSDGQDDGETNLPVPVDSR